jgi:hypothetical protein
MKKKWFYIVLILALFLRPTPIYANMIWPSLYIAEDFRTWWIIVTGLLIEFIFVKIFTKDSYFKSALMAIIINLISTLIGIIAIPLSGIIGEFIFIPIDLLFKLGSFHISHWILAFLLTVLCNTVIEALTLKIIFKKIFKNIFLWLFIANSISVIICAIKMSPRI